MQALIITAYRDGATLLKNMTLLSKYFLCYIHIDKKSALNTPEYLAKLNRLEHVTAISTYSINWGSYLHMMAIFDLLKAAYADSTHIQRFHIISGDDFPIQGYDAFVSFFESKEHCRQNFIELTDIRNMPPMQRRYEKFHFLHIFNYKSKNVILQTLRKIIQHTQYLIPFRRRIHFDYKGLVWGSLSREGVARIMEYMTPQMIRTLKYCEIPEEFMLQNALMTSPLAETIVTDNLRYDDWNGCKTGPRVLELADYETLKASSAFFARKIQCSAENPKATELYQRLFEDFTHTL